MAPIHLFLPIPIAPALVPFIQLFIQQTFGEYQLYASPFPKD